MRFAVIYKTEIQLGTNPAYAVEGCANLFPDF